MSVSELMFLLMAIETGLVSRGPASAEALWTIGSGGTLMAYDGWTSTPAAQVDAGLPTGPFAPSLCSGGGLLWVHALDGHLAIVDPAACSVVTRLTVPHASPPGMGVSRYAFGALWFGRPGQLWRVTARGKRTVTELPDGFGCGACLPTAVAVTSDWLWLGTADDEGTKLLRVDPATGQVTLSARLPGIAIHDLGAGPPGLVVTAVNRPDVYVLDPDTGNIRWSTQIPDASMVVFVYPTGDSVWAVGTEGAAIRLGGPKTPVAATVELGEEATPGGADAGLGSLWIADEDWETVIRVDTGTGRILARIPVIVGECFTPLAGESTVWVLDWNGADGFSRIDPATNQAVRIRESSGVNDFSAAIAPQPAPAR